MFRRPRALLLAAGFLAPIALVGVPATSAGAGTAAHSAIAQDLVLSATSGAPGTTIRVSSDSCARDDGSGFQELLVRLVIGTAPNQQLAALGDSTDGDQAELVLPDWVDASQPATLEASCSTYGNSDTPTVETYDPVAFDVLPGGAPTQTRTFSRTTLLAGQGFNVDIAGCSLPHADLVAVAIFPSHDLSGADLASEGFDSYGGGEGEVSGGSGTATAVVSNASLGFEVSGSDSGPLTTKVDEIPLDIAPGQYLALVACFNSNADSDASVLYQPQLITVTGSAPTGDVDLSVAPGTSTSVTADIAGGSCTEGPVTVAMLGESGDEASLPSSASRAAGKARAVVPWRRAAASVTAAPATSASALRAVLPDFPGVVTVSATPDATGAWAATHPFKISHGDVVAFAQCGDPTTDGFVYDPQGAVIKVAPTTTTSAPTTTTAPVPLTPAAPAGAVPGSPTFTG